ncbi:MAG TPA: hypothetical protein VI653_04195 [Steroidobacteraceae bacterium]
MPPFRIPPSTVVALATVAIGWFWMDILVSDFGAFRRVTHFYELGTVLLDPSWLVHGVARWHGPEAFAFGTVSAAILIAPLAAHRLGTRAAWLLYAAPLVFMSVCGGVLYAETSEAYVTAPPGAGAVGAFLTQFVNGMIGKAADSLARHISIGAGGYLSLLAAVWLSFIGVREYFPARALKAD